MTTPLQTRIADAVYWLGRDNNTGTRIAGEVVADAVKFAWSVDRKAGGDPVARQFAQRVAESGLALLTAHDSGKRADATHHARQISVALAVLEGLTGA